MDLFAKNAAGDFATRSSGLRPDRGRLAGRGAAAAGRAAGRRSIRAAGTAGGAGASEGLAG